MGQRAGFTKEGAELRGCSNEWTNESAARESTCDPPFALLKVGEVSADSYQQKTIQHIAVNCRLPSIARPTATLFHVEATAVDGEHGGT